MFFEMNRAEIAWIKMSPLKSRLGRGWLVLARIRSCDPRWQRKGLGTCAFQALTRSITVAACVTRSCGPTGHKYILPVFCSRLLPPSIQPFAAMRRCEEHFEVVHGQALASWSRYVG